MNFSFLSDIETSPHNLPFVGYRCSFPGIKRRVRDVDHSTLSSAEVKNGWSHTFIPALRLCGVNRDSFAFCRFFTLYIRKLIQSHNNQLTLTTHVFIAWCLGTSTVKSSPYCSAILEQIIKDTNCFAGLCRHS